MEFSRQKNTGVSCHLLLQGSSRPRDGTHVSCVSCFNRWTLYHLHHRGSEKTLDREGDHRAKGVSWGPWRATEGPTSSHFRMISGPPWRAGSEPSARTAAAGSGARLPSGPRWAPRLTWGWVGAGRAPGAGSLETQAGRLSEGNGRKEPSQFRPLGVKGKKPPAGEAT